MDHRLIAIGEQLKIILLDRLESDKIEKPWQVLVSTFADDEYRYDEWFDFETAKLAKDFIADFSEKSAEEFLRRAALWLESRYARTLRKQPVIN